MWIIVIVIGLLFGLFAFSQIIYPLFVAWPRASRLGHEGKLKKRIPMATFLVAPVAWTISVYGSIWIMNKYFGDYLKLYYGILGVMLVVVILQIPKKNRDLDADFKDTWKEYLKEE